MFVRFLFKKSFSLPGNGNLMLPGSFELLDSRDPPVLPSLTTGTTAPEEVCFVLYILPRFFLLGTWKTKQGPFSWSTGSTVQVGRGHRSCSKEHKRCCFSSDRESQGLPAKLSRHMKCTYVLEVIDFNSFFSSASHFKGLQVVPSIYFH